MNIWKICAAALVWFAAPTAALAQSQFEAAMSSFKEGNFAEAAERFAAIDAAYRDAYEKPDRVLYCARTREQNVYYSTLGVERENKVLVLGDEWCKAIFLAGYSYVELGKVDAALPLLRRAAALSPAEPQFQAELAYAIRLSGELDGALEAYRRAEEIARLGMADKDESTHFRAVALRGIGYVLIDKDQWSAAADAYRASLELEPDNEVAQSELQFIAKNGPAHD